MYDSVCKMHTVTQLKEILWGLNSDKVGINITFFWDVQ